MTQASSWLSLIFSEAMLLQLMAFGAVLAAAWLLQFLPQRLLYALESRFVQIGWTRPLFAVARRALLPVLVLILSLPVVIFFRSQGWADTFLVNWLIPFVWLWLLYRIIETLLNLNMSPTQARLWSTKVLLPLLFLAGILNGLGVLDDLLRWGPALGGNQRITIGSIITGLVVVALFFMLARRIRHFLEGTFLPQTGAEPALAHAVSTLITYTVVVIGAMTALNMIGFDLTTLTVIVGGLSVGLGFGLQQIVNNFVSGFILMFDRSIGPGDIIEVGNTRGTVQNIGIRSMIVRTADNIELIIPNSRFLTETMVNLTRTDPTVRVRISVVVAYTANPRQVEQDLLVAAQHPYVLDEPPPSVQFQDFGGGNLHFDLLVWTNEPARIPALTSDLRYSIWDTLATHQLIELTTPQPTIHVHLNEP
ncbi:MAG TPA: mechanosensitive ion channel domain-containing protein [Anaerolineae bacterium]|nr:mechanosensitive ion channel domain-containing protein [Anaerolineae bacterium]HXW00316.1 mechanosensitive ion channel domain-containing protein [Anaerolineae bacterium]